MIRGADYVKEIRLRASSTGILTGVRVSIQFSNADSYPKPYRLFDKYWSDAFEGYAEWPQDDEP